MERQARSRVQTGATAREAALTDYPSEGSV